MEKNDGMNDNKIIIRYLIIFFSSPPPPPLSPFFFSSGGRTADSWRGRWEAWCGRGKRGRRQQRWGHRRWFICRCCGPHWRYQRPACLSRQNGASRPNQPVIEDVLMGPKHLHLPGYDEVEKLALLQTNQRSRAQRVDNLIVVDKGSVTSHPRTRKRTVLRKCLLSVQTHGNHLLLALPIAFMIAMITFKKLSMPSLPKNNKKLSYFGSILSFFSGLKIKFFENFPLSLVQFFFFFFFFFFFSFFFFDIDIWENKWLALFWKLSL